MTDIKLISKETDISKLKMRNMNWDVVIGNRPYYVTRIDGYVHTIGGKWGENNLWAYPRDEQPTYENLVEYGSANPVNWGIKFEPHHYMKTKWGETDISYSGSVTITRNGEDFYTLGGGINYGIDKARVLISELQEHALDFDLIDYDKKMIGRKVWYRSQPAIITRWIKGQACVILEPDGIDSFKTPAEFENDDMFGDDENKKSIKTEVFNKSIYWFRE